MALCDGYCYGNCFFKVGILEGFDGMKAINDTLDGITLFYYHFNLLYTYFLYFIFVYKPWYFAGNYRLYRFSL